MKALILPLLMLVPFVPAAAAQDEPPVGHTDVFLPQLMGCTWSGSYKPYLSTPLATVWMFTCDPET